MAVALAPMTERQQNSKTVSRQEMESRRTELEEALERATLWLYGDEPGAPPGSPKWQQGLARYEGLQTEWKSYKLALDQLRLQEQAYDLKLRTLYDVLLFTSPPLSVVEYLDERSQELTVDGLVWLRRWQDIRAGGPSAIDDIPGRAG